MPPFQYLLLLTPLGFLYGSTGRFLSPENLVGRSGRQFPPSAATVSGLYAATHGPEAMQQDAILKDLQVAGPFWTVTGSKSHPVQNFYVPTPFQYRVQKEQDVLKQAASLRWRAWADRSAAEVAQGTQPSAKSPEAQAAGFWDAPQGQEPVKGKFVKNSWVPIQEWANPQNFAEDPWEFVPHLHPRLLDHERRVAVPDSEGEDSQGSLFLENAVQLKPDHALVYLSNVPLESGWYRFGGEGHLVELECLNLAKTTRKLLQKPLGQEFALITPAVWGSTRYSYRQPYTAGSDPQPLWPQVSILTERPSPHRYRLGRELEPAQAGKNNPYRLSRGRYAVPAGTVYHLGPGVESLDCWQQRPVDWFPREGYSFKRWGCGLALPL